MAMRWQGICATHFRHLSHMSYLGALQTGVHTISITRRSD
jgi:hypothetical protein